MSTTIRRGPDGVYQDPDDLLRVVLNGEEPETEPKRLPPHPKTLAAHQERVKRPYTRREPIPVTAFDWERAKRVMPGARQAKVFCIVNLNEVCLSAAARRLVVDGQDAVFVAAFCTPDAFAIRVDDEGWKVTQSTTSAFRGSLLSELQQRGFEPGRYPLHWDEEHRALIAYKAEREG